jgi:hypothetical protein
VEHVEACWSGIEWTTGTPLVGPLTDGSAWRPKVPRYHVHLHAVVALSGSRWRWNDDGTADPAGAWAELRDTWCRLSPGSSPAAQDLRRLEAAEGGLAEVLKYPFKPTETTVACVLEAVSVTRGMHPHQTSGAWHGGSKRWREAAEAALEAIADGTGSVVPLVAAAEAKDAHLLRPPAPALYRPGGGGPWRGPDGEGPWGPWGETRAAVPVSVAWLREVQPGALVDVALYDPRWRTWSTPTTIAPELALELAAATISPTVADAGPLEQPRAADKHTRRHRPVSDDIHTPESPPSAAWDLL